MAERQLTLKTGVVSRLAKEVSSYQRELEAAQRRADKMRADGEEPAKVRQADKVIDETRVMIPDSQRRLGLAITELHELITANTDLQDSVAWKKANEALEAASA